ncbi:MAG TPA: hypothetical protein VLV83_27430, partial [Acidobacteriota bacterium]|nr:hypothetical protein [Acidobacteriota bacterium]
QFERAPDGVYRPVAPGRNLDPQKGSRLEGATLQIGLTQGEIEDLKKRLAKLLRKVDEGHLEVMASSPRESVASR